MPHTRTETVWKFDELSDSAKQKAMQDWRAGHLDYEWWDSVYDDAVRMGAILGIEIDHRAGRKADGTPTKGRPSIYFSGFWSQGDGACFEGVYRYAKGCAKAIREEAPKDDRLHSIADTLTAIQRPHFYRLSARIKHTGRYYHERSIEVDVYDGEGDRVEAAVEDAISDAMSDFCSWIYRQLEQEYRFQMSDEQIAESIEASGAEFYENGSRA